MTLYIIVWVLSIVLSILITRLVFEIPKFSKKADEIAETSRRQAEILQIQTNILTLLLHSEFADKKVALINKVTSSVKTVNIAELVNYDLALYEIQVLNK